MLHFLVAQDSILVCAKSAFLGSWFSLNALVLLSSVQQGFYPFRYHSGETETVS